jgi:hypothetical protein
MMDKAPTLCIRTIQAAAAIGLAMGICRQASAQRDAPVWECYLPRFSLYHDRDEGGQRALVLEFAVRKNGGPHEHTEHQCHVLACLASQTQNILAMARDPALSNKKSEKVSFLDMLAEKKLAVVLDSKVAKLNSPDGRTPMFPDASGKPMITGAKNVDQYAFPFTFTFRDEDLLAAAAKLGGFDPAKLRQGGQDKWYEQAIALLVLVPVNDSRMADKVAKDIRARPDFAHPMDTDTSILICKALPYALTFSKHGDDPFKVDVN